MSEAIPIAVVNVFGTFGAEAGFHIHCFDGHQQFARVDLLASTMATGDGVRHGLARDAWNNIARLVRPHGNHPVLLLITHNFYTRGCLRADVNASIRRWNSLVLVRRNSKTAFVSLAERGWGAKTAGHTDLDATQVG